MYWKLLAFISEIPAENRLLRGSEYLSKQVRQHRAELIQMVDQVDAISARQMAASDARMNETFGRLRGRLTLIVALAVGMGLLLAGFTIWRTLRLEQELEQRYRASFEYPAGVEGAVRAPGFGPGRRAAQHFARAA